MNKMTFSGRSSIYIQPDRITKKVKHYKNHMNHPYNVPVNNDCIPKLCYTYWHSNQLPLSIKNNFISMIRDNPSIKFHLYHEKQAFCFISTHFPDDVAYAFQHLIPKAYKCDLWKYCILYIHGGMYIDMKYTCYGDFRLEELCREEHFVLDRDYHWEYDTYGIYPGIICVKPHSEVLKQCIDRIVENVRKGVFGWNPHYPTGSGLLGTVFLQGGETKPIQLSRHKTYGHIYLHDKCILKEYSEYYSEIECRYNELWYSNLIYEYEYKLIHQELSMTTIDKISIKKVLCVYHIGNYDIFVKMKPYLDNILKCHGTMYQLDLRVCIIDTVSKVDCDEICKYLPFATIYKTSNYGFDIASFIYILNMVKQSGNEYDYVFKLHTKTCDKTRDRLLGPLFRDTNALESVMYELEKDDVGMVASEFSDCDHLVRFADVNIHYVAQLIKKYFDDDMYYTVPFVAGTMFCISFDLLKKYFFQFDLYQVYNSFHSQYTFDYHWYYCNHYNDTRAVGVNAVALYTHYQRVGKNKGYSRNLFDALQNKDNSSKYMRDGMLEHGYERFFAYIVAKEDKCIRFLGKKTDDDTEA